MKEQKGKVLHTTWEITEDEVEEQPQTKAPSEETDCQEVIASESAQHTENATIQRRISAKMRRGTLEAYKQAFLVPTKLNDRKAVYLSKATQERADFIVRRLGDRGSNLSSFVENIVRIHLEEYGEDIEEMEKAVNRRKRDEEGISKELFHALILQLH